MVLWQEHQLVRPDKLCMQTMMPANKQRAVVAMSAAIYTVTALAKEASDRKKHC
jgi:hypothetical protein